MADYQANKARYDSMIYNRCGNSGVKLPAVSLGLWQHFGGVDVFENSREMVRKAFDLGITHFDLANNYGPPGGSAEETLGRILKLDFSPHRDELMISTKAGFGMWEGPYGDWGSKKFMTASLDQSLKRLGLDYVDIFYSHRYDPETPLEETMDALSFAVKQGKALYAGISNYPPEQARQAAKLLKENHTPCLIHQHRYSMLNRGSEEGLLEVLEQEGIGNIAFCPLAQGLLTDRYLKGIPTDSRAAEKRGFWQDVTEDVVDKVTRLNAIAAERGQSMAQMALAWALRGKRVTSVLIGASRVSQIEDNVKTLEHTEFGSEELERIDAILKG